MTGRSFIKTERGEDMRRSDELCLFAPNGLDWLLRRVEGDERGDAMSTRRYPDSRRN